MTKKNSRSALWYFVIERLNKEGRRNCNMKDEIEKYYPEWQAMSCAERSIYQSQYDRWKSEIKKESAQIEIKPSISTASLSFDSTLDQQISSEDVTQDLSKYFLSLVEKKKAEGSRSAELHSLVCNHHWFILSFQTFCRCDEHTIDRKRYSPYWVLAEVGLVEYSIGEGVINHYHAFIKPNPAPMGYRSKCKEEEKEGHKIPYDNFEKAKPCDLVFEEIKNFLLTNSTSDESYPLFCLNKDIEETRFALNFLRDSKKGIAENFETQRVLPLESLLIYIASLKKCEISNYSATNILTAYTYDYTPTSRCQFHEGEDVIKCAIGCSKRYSFLISDYICHLYNVKLTDNHIPMEKSVSVQVFPDNFRSIKGFSHRYNNHGISNHRMPGTSNYRAMERPGYGNESTQDELDDDESIGENMDDDGSTFSTAMSSSVASNTYSNTKDSQRKIISAEKNVKIVEQNFKTKVADRFENSSSIISSIKREKTTYDNESDILMSDAIEEDDEWDDLGNGNAKPRTIVQYEDNEDTLSNITALSKHTIMSASSTSKVNTMGRGKLFFK